MYFQYYSKRCYERSRNKKYNKLSLGLTYMNYDISKKRASSWLFLCDIAHILNIFYITILFFRNKVIMIYKRNIERSGCYEYHGSSKIRSSYAKNDKSFSTISIHASIKNAQDAITKYIDTDMESKDQRDQYRYHIERLTLIEIDGHLQQPNRE